MHPLSVRFLWSTKLLVQLLIICAGVIGLVTCALILSTAQSNDEERKFKNHDFPGMPLRIRKVKNLQSKDWPNELEIEIENISDKNVYFINAHLQFPDVPVPNGIAGVTIKFGKIENMDIAVLAKPEDEHLEPGQTLTLVIPVVFRKGLVAREKKAPHVHKKFEFDFGIISFGDGTGYEAGDFLDLRKKKASAAVPDSDRGKKNGPTRNSLSGQTNNSLAVLVNRTLKTQQYDETTCQRLLW